MPALSPTMTQGNIAEWKVAAGDKVSAGDVMADIETDKATMALESMEDGYIAKILMPSGAQDILVGELVAIMVEEEGDCASFADFTGSDAAPPALAPVAAAAPAPPAPPAAAPAPAPAPPAAPAAPSPRASGERVFASPKARMMAAEAGIALSQIKGTGPGGRIVMTDVALAVKEGVQTLAAGVGAATGVGTTGTGVAANTGAAADADAFARFFPPFEDVSVSQIKKITAARLTESKRTVPHFYLTVDVRMDALTGLRGKLNAGLESGKISVNDFVIKASAAALRKV